MIYIVKFYCTVDERYKYEIFSERNRYLAEYKCHKTTMDNPSHHSSMISINKPETEKEWIELFNTYLDKVGKANSSKKKKSGYVTYINPKGRR